MLIRAWDGQIVNFDNLEYIEASSGNWNMGRYCVRIMAYSGHNSICLGNVCGSLTKKEMELYRGLKRREEDLRRKFNAHEIGRGDLEDCEADIEEITSNVEIRVKEKAKDALDNIEHRLLGDNYCDMTDLMRWYRNV